MRYYLAIGTTVPALCLNLLFIRSAQAQDAKKAVAEPLTVANTRAAAERGLSFLIDDAAKWRKEKTCATCHHGTMTVWALAEATSRGFTVAPATFSDVVQWTKERLKDIDKARDTRPGWSMLNTPALYMASMALAVPKQDAVTTDELQRIAGHLLRHQEKDGAWAWSSAPPKNRPPPHFESDEVATLLAIMALQPHVPADPKATIDFNESRTRAADWLMKNPATTTTQATLLRLLRDVRAGRPAQEIAGAVAALLGRQRPDGGFGQDKDLPSDAYATGQTLYYLSLAGVDMKRAEIQRAANHLIATQREDGSWPMKGRAHPGATPTNYLVPITYFGSAWATLGLMRASAK